MKTNPLAPGLVIIAAVACFNCGRTGRVDTGMATATAKPIGKPIEIKPPLGLPPVPIPADNPVTAETIALGRQPVLRKETLRGQLALVRFLP